MLEWQGQGFYKIDRPGQTQRDNAYMSDDIFNQFSTNYTVWEPRFDYHVKGSPVLRGIVCVNQQINFELKGVVEMFGEAVGLNSPDTADYLVDGILDFVLFSTIPPLGSAKIAIDLVFSLTVSYTNPREYSATLYEGCEDCTLKWLEQGARWE